MNCAIYARVSTRDKGQDVHNQLVALREFAAKQGWSVCQEESKSAYTCRLGARKALGREAGAASSKGGPLQNTRVAYSGRIMERNRATYRVGTGYVSKGSPCVVCRHGCDLVSKIVHLTTDLLCHGVPEAVCTSVNTVANLFSQVLKIFSSAF
jgi:hypothetical protein